MDMQSLSHHSSSWLSEPFLDLGDAGFLSQTSRSSSDMTQHSPVSFSDSTSESSLVIVRKRKADSEKSGSSRNGETNSREHSQESDELEIVQKSRKGHKKSRQGCFNCKKRKIKCQETKPACDNCARKSIDCVYPPPRTLTALRVPTTYSPNPLASVNLQETPTAFSLTDMRLFHHYMMEAYPHLPVGNDSAWISQVPLIAHHNQYLMHAILGMSASHFELVTGENLSSTALYHRALAIKGSNDAMGHPRRSGSEADALLASCFLLAFQSSYMKDGLSEFFRTIRGCTLVTDQLRAEKLPMSFYISGKVHFNFMSQRLLGLPVIPEEFVEGARNSLLGVEGELSSEANAKFYRGLLRTVEAAPVSSLQVYFNWCKVYHMILQLSDVDFDDFIKTQNLTGRVLIAHFLAIQIVIGPILDREWQGRQRSTPIRTNLDWINGICLMLPQEKKSLVSWAREIAKGVDEELAGIVNTVSKVSILRRKEGLNTGVV